MTDLLLDSGILEILETIADVIETTPLAELTLGDLMSSKLHSVYNVSTPKELPVQIDSFDDVKIFLIEIIRNFFNMKSESIPCLWMNIFKGLKKAVCGNLLEQRAGLCFFLALSKLNDISEYSGDVIFSVEGIEAVADPSILLALLKCEDVDEIFQNLKDRMGGVANYAIPPTIIRINSSSTNVLGWVCTDNCIAVLGNQLDAQHVSSVGVVNLFNIICHECCHGIIRQCKNNFNINTKDLIDDPLAEGGELFEKAFWGMVPQWNNPISSEYAEVIATTWIENFQKFQHIVPIKPSLLGKVVGRRTGAASGLMLGGRRFPMM